MVSSDPDICTLPVTFRLFPSNMRLDSTVALGAVPSRVITPLSVVPVNVKVPDVPEEPEDPEDPLEPEEPLEPDVPLDPLVPEVPPRSVTVRVYILPSVGFLTRISVSEVPVVSWTI